jgi:dimethylhistidine N-methyltransferase
MSYVALKSAVDSCVDGDHGGFYRDVKRGLSATPKFIPCKYFYDDAGSRLFDRICTLEEYYLTRTERSIMLQYVDEMVDEIESNRLLIEYGSGSSEKTRILLDNLDRPAGYVPVDISSEQLTRSAEALSKAYPGLRIIPVCADYTSADFSLEEVVGAFPHRVVYFPGSTIGNFDPAEALHFLKGIAGLVGVDGGLLIGIDLKKEPSILEAAYNDQKGITAQFNLNVLRRMNRELGANFCLDRFRHRAFYNEQEGRVEMHLVSQTDQTVRIGETVIDFAAGESIHTENSYKYSLDDFERLATLAGFCVRRVWKDDRSWFSVQYLSPL